MTTSEALEEKIRIDLDEELVVELIDWLQPKAKDNPRIAAAALVAALSSIIAQTSSNEDQAVAVATIYGRFLIKASAEMKHIELHHKEHS
jgi:hypothetical protein